MLTLNTFVDYNFSLNQYILLSLTKIACILGVGKKVTGRIGGGQFTPLIQNISAAVFGRIVWKTNLQRQLEYRIMNNILGVGKSYELNCWGAIYLHMITHGLGKKQNFGGF